MFRKTILFLVKICEPAVYFSKKAFLRLEFFIICDIIHSVSESIQNFTHKECGFFNGQLGAYIMARSACFVVRIFFRLGDVLRKPEQKQA